MSSEALDGQAPPRLLVNLRAHRTAIFRHAVDSRPAFRPQVPSCHVAVAYATAYARTRAAACFTSRVNTDCAEILRVVDHFSASSRRRVQAQAAFMTRLTARCRPLVIYIAASIVCSIVGAQQLNSKQWLHAHCKAYQEDYSPLINSYLSRYSYGISVDDVLGLTTPPGRSKSVIGNMRPVVYIVNNTLYYVDRKLAGMDAGGAFSAGFSTYFTPVIRRSVTSLLTDHSPSVYQRTYLLNCICACYRGVSHIHD